MASRNRPLNMLRCSARLSSYTQFQGPRAAPRKAYAAPPLPPQFTPFWTGSRVLLLASFAAAGAYLVGVSDAGPVRSKLSGRSELPKHQYGSRREMEKAIKELRMILGEELVSTDAEDLHRHGFSEWSSTNVDTLPVAVAYPKSTKNVSDIARVCSRHRVPMVPYSGGSSLEGNFSAPFGGISVDFAYMDEVLAFHPEDMDVVVQPSVPWMELNEHVKDEGLFFPVDPGPSAQIGGMVGTGCSGTNAVRYGTMKDWVINLTVVLADGRIIKTRRRPRKSSAGYNLNGLFVGSEGTLGIITEITLKLAVIPQETSVAVATFPTIRDAAAAASKVIRAGVPIAAMELMDDVHMRVINQGPVKTGRNWREDPTIFFKFSGTNAGVKENATLVKSISAAHGSSSFAFARSAAERDALWSARKEALWSILAMRQGEGDRVWSTDVAVPFSKLPDLIETTKRDLDALGIFAGALGHVGDGNFHSAILYDGNDAAQRAAVEEVVQNSVDRALDLEGTCTGEHGVGLGKKQSLLKELGVDTVYTMKMIKAALDPQLLLNPGKVVDFPEE